MKYKRGTNQFKKKEHNVLWYIPAYIAVVILLGIFSLLVKKDVTEKVWAEQPMVSGYVSPTPILVREETPEQEKIVKEIKEVFGVHADKAFKLLSCENSSLNPNAVNTHGNVPEGSRDIGVFQINEYWQKVQGRFLFNPSINIRIAYEIFEASNYSFERWTCGRRFGI